MSTFESLHQEGAKVGYNPHKPGCPSHTYHSYLMANTHLVLEVNVLIGDGAHTCHSLPGLISLLNRLPDEGQPAFIRGDCEWGNDLPGAWTGFVDPIRFGMGVERKYPSTAGVETGTAGGGGSAPLTERSPDRS